MALVTTAGLVPRGDRLFDPAVKGGFDATRAPEILGPRRRSMSPEEALVVAAGLPAEGQATPR